MCVSGATSNSHISSTVLTVIALGAGVGRHGAVAGVVLPLLDADAHVGTGVLLAGGARTWGGRAKAW